MKYGKNKNFKHKDKLVLHADVISVFDNTSQVALSLLDNPTGNVLAV